MASQQSAPEKRSRPEDVEILLAVYQGMRSESLQHRLSISTSYGLAIAGLLAIGAGALTQEGLPLDLKVALTAVLMSVCIPIFVYIRQQRKESDKSMQVMRKIEEHYDLFEFAKYINRDSVLPEEWRDPPSIRWVGLTRGDMNHVGSLGLVALVLIVVFWMSP